MKSGEHKTVQARIFEYAEAIGWSEDMRAAQAYAVDTLAHEETVLLKNQASSEQQKNALFRSKRAVVTTAYLQRSALESNSEHRMIKQVQPVEVHANPEDLGRSL